MRNCAKEKYLSDRPALLCSCGTRIEAMNEAARMTGRFVTGSDLSRLMSPTDTLKYEASSRYVFSAPAFVFPIDAGEDISWCAAYFEEILERRFAVAVLYSSYEECLSDTESDDFTPAFAADMINRLIGDLLCFPDEDFVFSYNIRSFFGRNVIESAMKKIVSESRLLECDISFEYCGEGDGLFDRVISENQTIMLGLALQCVSEISSDRRISVEICKGPGNLSVTLSANTDKTDTPITGIEALSNAVPTVSGGLAVCEYIAGLCGCDMNFTCRRSENGLYVMSLSIVEVMRKPPDAEFKCPIPESDFDGFCKKSAKILDFMKSSAKQQ